MTARQIESACRGPRDIVHSKKKVKKVTRKSIIKSADTAFSLFIRARDPFCVTCGAQTNDCSHLFRRGHHNTRWNPKNAFGQCRRCHFIHHNQTESYLHDYAKKKMGAMKYDALREEWRKVSDFKDYQIAEIGRYFKEKVK
jgi:5-methylcytosine-specific restriction endonuclease McrA